MILGKRPSSVYLQGANFSACLGCGICLSTARLVIYEIKTMVVLHYSSNLLYPVNLTTNLDLQHYRVLP